MFFFLLLVYSMSLFFILFDLNILFVNEEFLIFICMSILFFLLVNGARKFVNFTFFLKVEFIYFFFIYLILLNIKLIEKMLNLVSLENLKLDSLVITELYTLFADSVNEMISSEKIINLYLTKNIILLLNTNVYSAVLLPFSTDFFTKIFLANNRLVQFFELKDINYSFYISRGEMNTTIKILTSSFLYSEYSLTDFSDDFLNDDVIELAEVEKINSIEDFDLLSESSIFTNAYLNILS